MAEKKKRTYRKRTPAEKATGNLAHAKEMRQIMNWASGATGAERPAAKKAAKSLMYSYGKRAGKAISRAVENTNKDFQQTAKKVRRQKKADTMARAYSGGRVKVK